MSGVIDALLDVSQPATYSDGEPLIKVRALGGRDGYVLLAGEVAVHKEGTPDVVVSAPALLGEMLQFNPRAQRTATVSAHGPATALKFAWEEFYARLKQRLPAAEQDAVLEAIERSVWERFGDDTIIKLSLFAGLPERIRLRASLVLQSVVERRTLSDGQVLFEQDDFCSATGYIVLRGAVRVVKTNFPPRIVSAPGILGVMLRFDPNLQWSAGATAQGEVELFRFNWQDYLAILKRRLSEPEMAQFAAAIDSNAPSHFIH